MVSEGSGFMTMPRQEAMQPWTRLLAKRIVLVEGCVRSDDPRVAPAHIAAGLEASFEPPFTAMGKNPEVLTIQGRTRPH